MGRHRAGRWQGGLLEQLEDRLLLSAATALPLALGGSPPPAVNMAMGSPAVGATKVVNLLGRLDVVITYLGQATGLGGVVDRYQVNLASRSVADMVAAVDINFFGSAYQAGTGTASLAEAASLPDPNLDSHLLLVNPVYLLTVRAPSETNDMRFGGQEGFGSSLGAVVGIRGAGQVMNLPLAHIAVAAGQMVYLSGAASNGSGQMFTFGTSPVSGISIDANAASTTPVVTAGATALAYAAPGAAKAIDAGLTLLDGNSANLAGATVRISANYVAGQDVLGFTNQNGITGVWDASTGTLTLTGTASQGAYQMALRSVAYLNASASPNLAQRTVSFQITDGTTLSAAACQKINVTLLNRAPTVSNLAGTVGKNVTWTLSAATFTAGFTDPDAGNSLQKIKITALPGRGILRLNGVAVITNQEIAVSQLGKLTYTPATGYVGADSFSWNGSDGALYGSAAAKMNLNVVNGGPTVTDISKNIAASSTLKMTASLFTAAYSDPNADSLQKIKITSLPARGTLYLSGVAVQAGQEIAASQLGALTFTAVKGYVGNDSFGWNASDGTAYAANNALFKLKIG